MQRTVDRIAAEHGRHGTRCPHAYLAGCVTPQRQQRQTGREFVPIVDEIDPARFDDRQDAVFDAGQLQRVAVDALLLPPILEVAPVHEIARIGKGRHPATVLQPRIPVDMVDMQVGAEHNGDRLRPDTGFRQTIENAAALPPMKLLNERPFLVFTDATIDQDRLSAGAEREGEYRKIRATRQGGSKGNENAILHETSSVVQRVQNPEPLLIMAESRPQRFGSVHATAIYHHDDGWRRGDFVKGLHEWTNELAKFIRVEMGHDFPEHLVGAGLHGADHGEEHLGGEASPAAMLSPELSLQSLLLGDLALGEDARGQALPDGDSPPAGARERKALQNRFIFIQQGGVALLGVLLEADEVQMRLGHCSRVRIEAAGQPVVA